jgi:hypothetical protein
MRLNWTLGRTLGWGATAGLAALALWPFLGAGGVLFWPFVLLAVASGVCGLAACTLTMLDVTFHRPRGERLRPVRAFDLLVGGALFVLALVEVHAAVGYLWF